MIGAFKMDHLDTLVSQAYKDTVKRIGGRGPRNIYTKILGNRIDIHFWLLKSPFEQFIFENFSDGKELLSGIYGRINEIIKDQAISEIQQQTGLTLEFISFEFCIEDDRFCFSLEIKGEREE